MKQSLVVQLCLCALVFAGCSQASQQHTTYEVAQSDLTNEDTGENPLENGPDIVADEPSGISSLCLLDMCIPDDLPINEDNETYTAQRGDMMTDEEMTTYTLRKDGSYFSMETSAIMSSDVTTIQRIDQDTFVRQEKDLGCGGGTIKQSVITKDGAEVVDYIFDELDESIVLGNITYSPSLVMEYASGPQNITSKKIGLGQYGDESFPSLEILKEHLKKDVFESSKMIYSEYVAEFVDHPGILFMYRADREIPRSLRVVFLGTDPVYLGENITQDGNFRDMSITNKIISYFEGSNQGFFDQDGNQIKTVSADNMPFFRVEKISQDGYYSVYLNSPYEIRTFAELCKPVVYYYSPKQEQNTLTFTNTYQDFTRLIPKFNRSNGWSFVAQDNKVIIGGKKFDYLYYSIKVRDYQHNMDGWIVKGSDIESFFDDKLPKLRFNETEKKDFMEYWVPEFFGQSYYFVSFKFTQELDEMVPLHFSKPVTNTNRILLDAYEIGGRIPENKQRYLYPQASEKLDDHVLKPILRSEGGREVFEWGGVLEKNQKIVIH